MIRFFSCCVCLILLFTMVKPVCSAPAVETVTVIVNGRTIADKGIINKGIAYIPLHKVLSILNINYKWDPSARVLSVAGKPVTGKLIRYKGVLYTSYLSVSNVSNLPVAFDALSKRVFVNPQMSADDLIASMGGKKTGNSINTKPIDTSPKSNISSGTSSSASINEPFVPVLGENDVFKVSVTNIEQLTTIKGQSPSNPANKFVAVYLSQQNVSNEVQIYTGKFALLDRANKVYEYSEGLSNFWLVVLRPGGSNFGYIVFEVPKDSQPMQLVLSTTSRPPLALNLR